MNYRIVWPVLLLTCFFVGLGAETLSWFFSFTKASFLGNPDLAALRPIKLLAGTAIFAAGVSSIACLGAERTEWSVAGRLGVGFFLFGSLVLACSGMFSPLRPVIGSYLVYIPTESFFAGLALVLVGGAFGAFAEGWRSDLGWIFTPIVAALVLVGLALGGLPDNLAHVRIELLLWAPGHSLKFAMIALVVVIWFRLADGLRFSPSFVGGRRIFLAGVVLPSLLMLPMLFYWRAADLAFLSAIEKLAYWSTWPGALVVSAFFSYQLFKRRSVVKGVVWWGLVLSLVFFSLAVAAGLSKKMLALHAVFFGASLCSALFALMFSRNSIDLSRESLYARAIWSSVVLGSVVLLLAVWGFASTGGSHRVFMAREATGVAVKVQRDHALSQIEAETRQRFDQGVTMLQRGEFDYASKAFHRVLELSPVMPEAHVNMGYALLGLNNFGAAKDFFTTAIDLKADQTNAYYGLGLALEGLGLFDGAVGAFNTYIHLGKPGDPMIARAKEKVREMMAKRDQYGSANTSRGAKP